ncbi:MAG: DUF5666 domain-containing protein, partial [Pseudomonadota bacterium]
QAITGGDVKAITGGDAQVIVGANIRAITAGDTRAITGGDSGAVVVGQIVAITGGDVQAITGADTRAITGGDTQAITGADARAITAGDTRAITGGDHRMSLKDDSKLVGPIESVNSESGTVTVLGQTVAATAFVKSFAVGDYVAIQGEFSRELSLVATRINRLPGVYVPGASVVRVTGITTGFSPLIGQVRIGSVSVDFVDASSMTTKLVEGFGILTSVDGVQPVPGGIVLATQVDDVTDVMLVK